MKVRISEQMILDWLTWDGFKFSIETLNMEKGVVRKVIPSQTEGINEFRLTSMVEFINNEIDNQLLGRRDDQEQPSQDLGVHVADRVSLKESIGPIPHPPPPIHQPKLEFNAVGLLLIDPTTGEVKGGKCTFFNEEKAPIQLDRGKKLLVEVK